jgi:hypothetical protein
MCLLVHQSHRVRRAGRCRPNEPHRWRDTRALANPNQPGTPQDTPHWWQACTGTGQTADRQPRWHQRLQTSASIVRCGRTQNHKRNRRMGARLLETIASSRCHSEGARHTSPWFRNSTAKSWRRRSMTTCSYPKHSRRPGMRQHNRRVTPNQPCNSNTDQPDLLLHSPKHSQPMHSSRRHQLCPSAEPKAEAGSAEAAMEAGSAAAG